MGRKLYPIILLDGVNFDCCRGIESLHSFSPFPIRSLSHSLPFLFALSHSHSLSPSQYVCLSHPISNYFSSKSWDCYRLQYFQCDYDLRHFKTKVFNLIRNILKERTMCAVHCVLSSVYHTYRYDQHVDKLVFGVAIYLILLYYASNSIHCQPCCKPVNFTCSCLYYKF